MKEGQRLKKQHVYENVDDVLKLPEIDIGKMIHVGDTYKPTTTEGDCLLLKMKSHLNPDSVQVVDAKPESKYFPITHWKYNADADVIIVRRGAGDRTIYPKKSVVRVPKRVIKVFP
ncbi:hypothetical protein L1987_27923 [Smallanthus sonchifolius]|uniref:Uncharacterized protein n=1 Tax=Smallanthus sonchifolius TaxID=185202 RepID=A0ACB9IB48_9ASTR|nr:hypothetical protein L1987_27923 [Smallanthus sonchifolius]